MGKLKGKIAIITGAASGIGAAASRIFVAEGAQVMLADRNQAGLADLARSLGEDKTDYATIDAGNGDQVKACIAQTIARFGGIDIALLNAGTGGKPGMMASQTEEDFDRVMAINARGVWLGLKYIMPEIARRGGGSIVVTASTAGTHAVPGLAPYIASKHAAIGLMRAAAMEGAPHKIRVNSVNPAPIDTPMIHELEDIINPDRGDTQPVAIHTPLRRYGEAVEVANMMLFLASDDSSFCTGGVYMVDGGVSAGRAG